MSLLKFRKHHKIIIAAISLCLLAGIFLVLFHHHSDGQAHFDCLVCRLIQCIAGLLALAFVCFLGPMPRVRSYFRQAPEKIVQAFLVTAQGNRAPPFSSVSSSL